MNAVGESKKKKKKVRAGPETARTDGQTDRPVNLIYKIEGFWFLLEDFLKTVFLHSEIFEFP